MTRMLFTLAAIGVVAAAGTARADHGGYAPPGGYSGYPLPSYTSEFHAPDTLFGMGAASPHKPPEQYGLLPGLRRAFRLNGGSCDECGAPEGFGHTWGCGGGKCKGGCGPFGHGQYGAPGYGYGGGGVNGGGYGPYGPVNQGTLVFPHHTFIRSPRDYFMSEPQR